MTAPVSYRALDADRIVATLTRLHQRIEDRFPGSSVSHLCDELLSLAEKARERADEIGKPIGALRNLSALLVVVIVGGTAAVLATGRLPEQPLAATELIQILEAAINDLVLIGAAIFFLTSLETRIKRARALRALHELRSIAHIIDMHQLTKDPERLLHRGPSTEHSPKETMSAFELSRYLDYCSEMLSLTGKLAALYVQRFDDAVALASVNEVESLCTGLSRKIWQKLIILQSFPGSTRPPDTT